MHLPEVNDPLFKQTWAANSKLTLLLFLYIFIIYTSKQTLLLFLYIFMHFYALVYE